MEHENSLGGRSLLYSSDPQFPHPAFLKSADAKPAKFGKTMCAECNGARSQDFDNAYDHFFKWSLSRTEQFRKKNSISWKGIYAGQAFDQRHLVRYYVKNMCCRIIDAGFDEVPDDLIDFLDDINYAPVVQSVTFKDFDLFDALAASGATEPYTSPYTRSARVYTSAESQHPGIFHLAVHEGFFGVVVTWWHPSLRQRIGRSQAIERQNFSKLHVRKNLPAWDPLFRELDMFATAVRMRNNGLNIMDCVDREGG